jgi:hypothetical protein
MGGCLGWACTLALVLALHACASPPAADSAAGGVGTVEAAATKPVGSVEALVIRVRGKNYSVVGEANTRLTDADIEAALGPYQAPKTWSAAVQPWTAHRVRNLDPARYLAVRTALTTVTVDLGTPGNPQPREFSTTGWALALGLGATIGPEVCPYLRPEFKQANSCPA